MTSCVLIARCTEDLTLDFDPGEILYHFELADVYGYDYRDE